jgi:hypothetical protein
LLQELAAGLPESILSLRPGLKPFEMKTILYGLSQAGERRRQS